MDLFLAVVELLLLPFALTRENRSVLAVVAACAVWCAVPTFAPVWRVRALR